MALQTSSSSSSIIFESDYPAPSLPECSVFQYLHPEISASPLERYDPALPAYIDGLSGRVLSRGEMRANALRLATGISKLGLKRGDVACLWGANSLGWVQAFFGCQAAGVVVSPANVAYSQTEIAHQINDSGAQLIFLDPSLLVQFNAARPLLRRQFPNARVVLLSSAPGPHASVGDLFARPSRAEAFDGAAAHDTALLCYSSGTTGLPKGVMTSHYNLTSELQALNAGSRQLVSGEDVVLGVLPFSHIMGLGMVFLQPYARGVPVVVLPKFQELPALKAIEKYRITHAIIVPPILITLLNSTEVHKYDLTSLRSVLSGAAPLGGDIADRFRALVPGIVMMQAYGNTETSPVVTSAFLDEFATRPGSVGTVGKLLPTYQARLVADGRDVGVGERGELWVKGPTIMKGYLRNPTATASAIQDGWYRTGDVVVVSDDGWYTVVDRVKELIKYKGFQVPPAELEALLLTHPSVADAGVVGVYDSAQATELPRAYIVAHRKYAGSHAQLSRTIAAWVAQRVANHKKLRGGVAVVDAVPKSPSGKILRKELRARAADEFKAAAVARL